MKIGVIIFILFVQFMIIGSFGGLHSYYLSSKDVLTEQTNDYFEAIAKSRANHIETLLEKQKEKVLTISDIDLIEDSLDYDSLGELNEELNEITTDRTGLGQTGEIYLINEHGYMITPSRFFPAEMTFLKLEVDTINSRNCLMMAEMDIIEHIEHEPVAVFEDYRGVKVLGTHAYIPEMKWCLLAEIDEAEALGELRDKLLISGFVISIIILIIIVFFIFLSGSFIKRLVEQAYSRKRGGKK